MTEKLANNLIKTFPALVNEKFYFEIEDGWYQIVFDLFTKIQKHCDYTKQKVTIVQVKEKFAGLRVYYSHEGGEEDNVIFDLVMEALNKSYSTCEQTGGVGSLYHRGVWVKTLCNESAILAGFEKTKTKTI